MAMRTHKRVYPFNSDVNYIFKCFISLVSFLYCQICNVQDYLFFIVTCRNHSVMAKPFSTILCLANCVVFLRIINSIVIILILFLLIYFLDKL